MANKIFMSCPILSSSTFTNISYLISSDPRKYRQSFTSTRPPQQSPQWFALWSQTKIKAKTQMTQVSHSSKWTISPMKLKHQPRPGGGDSTKQQTVVMCHNQRKINAQPLSTVDSALIPPGIIYFQKQYVLQRWQQSILDTSGDMTSKSVYLCLISKFLTVNKCKGRSRF